MANKYDLYKGLVNSIFKEYTSPLIYTLMMVIYYHGNFRIMSILVGISI